MPIEAKLDNGLSPAFFLPVIEALQHANSGRACPGMDDKAWIEGGVTRVLESVASGRDFLQRFVTEFATTWLRSTYFEGLKSDRRLELLREINSYVSRAVMEAALPDRLQSIPGLENYEVFAGGWTLARACHPRSS